MVRSLLAILGVLIAATAARAQDLVPGAYTPAPVGYNIITLLTSFSDGDLNFDPSVPITDGNAKIGAGVVGYNRTLNIGGRFASVGAAMPYIEGHLQGLVFGGFQETSRSGLSDLSARIAINLVGAPAMTRQQFAAYRPTTILGISFTVSAPLGQYYPEKLINIGTNRWYFKPEMGFSRKRGPWTFEVDLGATFFTANTDFFSGGKREQAPMASVQGHLIYAIRPGMWAAVDGNYWQGGRLTINGGENAEEQKNSRLGATFAFPIARQQIRVAYSFGAFTTIGGDFQSIGVSYSYAWASRP